VAPTVTLNPVTQTGYAGTTLTFTANASGTLTPTVQWQVSTNKGVSWVNDAGATSTSLTTAPLTTTESGWEVRAVFTNAAGTATTSAATITVLKDVAPKMTLQPTNVTVKAGTTASFTATASGLPTPNVDQRCGRDVDDPQVHGDRSTERLEVQSRVPERGRIGNHEGRHAQGHLTHRPTFGVERESGAAPGPLLVCANRQCLS
jgi:hypothetical protein